MDDVISEHGWREQVEERSLLVTHRHTDIKHWPCRRQAEMLTGGGREASELFGPCEESLLELMWCCGEVRRARTLASGHHEAATEESRRVTEESQIIIS
jgi:hypothetical protein